MKAPYSLSVLALSFGTVAATAGAQQSSSRDHWADSARVIIDASTQRRDIAGLRSAVVLIDRALTAFPGDPLLDHYRGYALYREGNLLATTLNDRAAAAVAFDSAAAALERSQEKLALPESFAVAAAVYGQQIGASSDPGTQMQLGMKAGSSMGRATAIGPRNPRVWLLDGISAMFTPPEYGGGLDKSEQYLTKAVSLFETDAPARPLPSWGRADAYIWLGQLYMKQGKKDAAHEAFVKATQAEPANVWASNLASGQAPK